MAAIMSELKRKKPDYFKVKVDSEVKSSIDTLRRELEDLHNIFDQATEPVLVDSIIYEMQAVQLKYMHYLNICKQRGIVSEEFCF